MAYSGHPYLESIYRPCYQTMGTSTIMGTYTGLIRRYFEHRLTQNVPFGYDLKLLQYFEQCIYMIRKAKYQMHEDC
jgi:hypothetical protein